MEAGFISHTMWSASKQFSCDSNKWLGFCLHTLNLCLYQLQSNKIVIVNYN